MPFPATSANTKPDFSRTHIEKIVVVSSYHACLHAVSGVVEGL